MENFKKPSDHAIFPMLYESAFKPYLEKWIAGDQEAAKDWVLNVAKGANIKVQIVDDQTKQFLFWVPPLLRGPKTHIGGTISQINTLAGQYAAAGYPPQAIRKFLLGNLPPERFTPEGTPDAGNQAWIDIALRYGYLSKEPLKSKSSNVSEHEDIDEEPEGWGE